MLLTPTQMKVGCTGDHGGIIGTELDGWIAEMDFERGEFLFQTRAKAGVCRHATSEYNLFDVIFLGRKTSFHC